MANLPLFIGIGGKAGEGVETLGQAIGILLARLGLEVTTNGEFYNAIKGSHNTFQLTADNNENLALPEKYNLVVAMDSEAYQEEALKIVPDGFVIFDPSLGTPDLKVGLIPVPFSEIAENETGSKLAKNMVLFGCLSSLVKASKELVSEIVTGVFKGKPDDLAGRNVRAALRGYDVGLNYAEVFNFQPPVNLEKDEKYFLTGNNLAALASVKAGCTFFAAYPMTPSTSILHYLALWERETGMSVNHVEDELAAINMAIGASYAGARSMVATSGGGYALMTEGVGLAAMLETPLVLIDVQRPGPATGLPTRTGQGDLRQVLHAGQGDVPHVVLSPGSHEEIFRMIRDAFEYSEIIKGPVTVLLEKSLAESLCTVKASVLNQERPIVSRDKNLGIRHAVSYEHDRRGLPTEDPLGVSEMQKYRWGKIKDLAARIPPARLEGPDEARMTLVCWGATYGAARVAAEKLTADGIETNLLHVKYFRPFQNGVTEILKRASKPILIEGNQTAQLGGLIRENTGIEIETKILDVTGRPFTAERLVDEVKALL